MADEIKFDPELRKKYSPVKSRVQGILQALPQSIDISTKKAVRNTAAESLMDLSLEGRTDLITGLRNERGGNESLRAEIERAVRNGQVLGLIALDLDNFNMVNDKYGHAKGDQVLKAIATILNDHARGKTSATRTIDIPARMGAKGDEFLVITPDIKEGLELAAGRIRLAIEKQVKELVPGIDDIPISASIGATSIAPKERIDPEERKNPHYEEVEKIMTKMKSEADVALYVSKYKGKNTLTIYQPGMVMPQGYKK